MKVNTSHADVVVVASQFNPSIITQHWLIKNNFFLEEEFSPDSVFSPLVADIKTNQFNILVMPERLQFTPKVDNTETQCNLITSKLGKIIEKLPHTPFSALGFNFLWLIDTEADSQTKVSRKLFFKNESNLYKKFDTDDANFGSYMSKDILGCRLKLEIKPVRALMKDNKNFLQCAFNFHLDLPDEEKHSVILGFLPNWIKAKEISEDIVKCLMQETL